MTIEKIRIALEEKKGKVYHFKFNGARNQVEEFEGKIVNTYPAVFIIRLENDNNIIKSFTYTDVLTESLEIINNVK